MKKTKNELYNLWINISSIPGWYRLLKIVNKYTNQYDNEDFTYLEELDTDFLEIEKKAKKEYFIQKQNNNKEMLEMQRALKEQGKEWIKRRRIIFLIQEIKKLESITNSSYKIYFEQQQRDVPFWLRQVILLTNNPEKLIKLRGKLINELYFLQNKNEFDKNQLTHEEIVHARNYPFERLIEINKAGFAKCPFHDDNRPSFWVKNNFGYCFSCGKSCDTIQFVIETQNLSFPEAVKKLNGI